MKNISTTPRPAKRAAAILASIIITGLLTACADSQDAIIVAGSTSVQPYAEVIAEEYMRQYPDNDIDIQGGGSSAGITATETGTAEIGMSSRALTQKEESFWSVEIAKDGLAIIVHPDNPVKSLTLEQIRGIYSASIADWSELGGNSAKIHIIAREDGSGTRSAFESLVMDSVRISPKAIVQDSNGTVRLLVSDDVNAIGFISLGLVDETVKALAMDGIEASRENVINGSYNLFRPFLFVCAKEPDGQTRKFIDYTLSSEGQHLLALEGLVPVLEENEV